MSCLDIILPSNFHGETFFHLLLWYFCSKAAETHRLWAHCQNSCSRAGLKAPQSSYFSWWTFLLAWKAGFVLFPSSCACSCCDSSLSCSGWIQAAQMCWLQVIFPCPPWQDSSALEPPCSWCLCSWGCWELGAPSLPAPLPFLTPCSLLTRSSPGHGALWIFIHNHSTQKCFHSPLPSLFSVVNGAQPLWLPCFEQSWGSPAGLAS